MTAMTEVKQWSDLNFNLKPILFILHTIRSAKVILIIPSPFSCLPTKPTSMLFLAVFVVHFTFQTVLAQANSSSLNNSTSELYIEVPPPSKPPVIPPCSIHVQICLNVLPPSYSILETGQLPRPFSDDSCTINYTDDNGNPKHPNITALEGGEGKPCGVNAAMKAESPYGGLEVTFRGNYSGLPGNPEIRYAFTRLPVRGWERRERWACWWDVQ